MKYKPLTAYLVILALLSTGFIVLMKSLDQQANYLAALYMLGPAIAAFLTRQFFYKNKYKNANMRVGKLRNYLKFWAISLGITVLSYVIYTLLGSIRWDASGQIFLGQLADQFALTGQNINDLPAGFTPRTMLVIYFIGGLTIFNILPGIITGFGEEFGWRGFMFSELYKIKPWAAFILGGLIWYAWHLPLSFVLTQSSNLTATQTILNYVVLAVGSVCTHIFLTYVYVKTENIWVTSLAHITLNNTARAFSYFSVVQNQTTANIGLTITMLIVVMVLYFSKEWKVFNNYFALRRLQI